MYPKVLDIYSKILAVAKSRRGQNLYVFSVFLLISLVLWFVMALNDVMQRDISMPMRIVNVPGSVTLVTNPPAMVDVSIRVQGTQRLKLALSDSPDLEVDFRAYAKRSAIRLSSAELKNVVRNTLGGASIVFVSPDTLNVLYTSDAGKLMSVTTDYKVTAGPQSSVYGEPRLSPDTVRVYSTKSISRGIKNVSTEPIRLHGLRETTTVRARVIAPRGTRVIPDSVDVTFNVEPLIYKTRRVAVEPINVPKGLKLITFPAQVEVKYMISMSDYKTSEPRMRVVADYRTIDKEHKSEKVRLKLTDVSSNLQNVHLAADSAEYIIERL